MPVMRVVFLAAALAAWTGIAGADGRCVEFQAAALQNEVADVARFINAGVGVNCRDPLTGETALMQAARNGSVDTVKLLLVSGADVAARAPSGQTALAIAVRTEGALGKGGPAFTPLRERIQRAIAALRAAGARD